MEVIVLAGGRGTRLADVLLDRPKPMADIAGRPFLEYLLDFLISQGFRNAVLSVGYLAEKIQAHFGDRYKGMGLSYAVERYPLGTGGAIRLSLEFSTESNVFVVNGDTYVQLDYRSMMSQHMAMKSEFSIGLRQSADVSRYGVVEVDDHGIIRSFGEKSSHGAGLINSGVYLLKKSLFESFNLPECFSIESDFIEPNLIALRPLGYLSDGFFIDIGIPSELERARRELPARCHW